VERAGMLSCQMASHLPDLAAELAEPLLHVAEDAAVAPVGIADLAGNPLQRVLQACADLGRSLARPDHGLGAGLLAGAHGGSVVRGRGYTATRPAGPTGDRSGRSLGFARAGGGVGRLW